MLRTALRYLRARGVRARLHCTYENTPDAMASGAFCADALRVKVRLLRGAQVFFTVVAKAASHRQPWEKRTHDDDGYGAAGCGDDGGYEQRRVDLAQLHMAQGQKHQDSSGIRQRVQSRSGKAGYIYIPAAFRHLSTFSTVKARFSALCSFSREKS